MAVQCSLLIPMEIRSVCPVLFPVVDHRLKLSIYFHWASLVSFNPVNKGASLSFSALAPLEDFARLIILMSKRFKEIPIARIIDLYEKYVSSRGVAMRMHTCIPMRMHANLHACNAGQ